MKKKVQSHEWASWGAKSLCDLSSKPYVLAIQNFIIFQIGCLAGENLWATNFFWA